MTALLEFLESLTFPVGQNSALIGATVQGIEGAPATVLLNGQPISYPVTLKASDVLKVARGQTSTDPDYQTVTRLYGTLPSTGTGGGTGGGTASFTVTTDSAGFQTVQSGSETAGPLPTRALFEGLQAQVSSIKQSDTSVARLQDSGADSVYVLGADAAPRAAKLLVLYYSVLGTIPEPRLLTELRLQVPDGAALPTGAVTLSVEGAPANVFGMELLTVANKTWLCIKTRAMVGSDDRVRVAFSVPYTVLAAATQPQDNNPSVLFIDAGGTETGHMVGMHYVTEGKRTIVGRLAADAMRIRDAATPFAQMLNGDFEIVQPSDLEVLSGALPYLHLRVRDMEYVLPFQVKQ